MRLPPLLCFVVLFVTGDLTASSPQTLPEASAILAKLRLVNGHFMEQWPDPGKPIVTNRERPSNIWTRGVYYEGLMALYAVDRDPKFYRYAVGWADYHKWGLRSGVSTRNADDQCCGQTYIELYQVEPRAERIRDIKACIENVVNSPHDDDWTWVDASQMAMPIYAKLGALLKEPKYFERMHQLYSNMKTRQGGRGLYSPVDHLWWRDADFVPPYREPNGKNCYWARGNGWVLAALARVLDVLPAGAPHRAEYVATFQEMCEALRQVQRADGFWNPSLHDPKNFGGKETSGTALFTYGMAWGVRHGVLDAAVYRPVIAKAWDAMAEEAVHPNGFLGYVQGTGKEPKDGQPTTYDNAPDFEDYGVGCFLLAGSEVYKMAAAQKAPP